MHTSVVRIAYLLMHVVVFSCSHYVTTTQNLVLARLLVTQVMAHDLILNFYLAYKCV